MLGVKFIQYASIYHRWTNQSMFKKIIEKLRFGSCKIKTTDNVNAFEESEKKKEDSTK